MANEIYEKYAKEIADVFYEYQDSLMPDKLDIFTKTEQIRKKVMEEFEWNLDESYDANTYAEVVQNHFIEICKDNREFDLNLDLLFDMEKFEKDPIELDDEIAGYWPSTFMDFIQGRPDSETRICYFIQQNRNDTPEFMDFLFLLSHNQIKACPFSDVKEVADVLSNAERERFLKHEETRMKIARLKRDHEREEQLKFLTELKTSDSALFEDIYQAARTRTCQTNITDQDREEVLKRLNPTEPEKTSNEPATPSDGTDYKTRLLKLKTLLEGGLITQEDYNTKKAEILSSI